MLQLLHATLVLLALTASAPAAEFAVAEIAPGVFVHAPRVALVSKANGGDTSNIGFIIGAESVAVIDTGTSVAIGRQLLAEIRARTPLPVSHVITTHMHPDHTLGNGAFTGSGAKFTASAKLPDALAARWESFTRRVAQELGADPVEGQRQVEYEILVDSELRLDLGNRPLLLKAWPTAHTDNDLTIYDEKTQTLFTGDLLFEKHLPAIDGSIRGWIAQYEALKALPAVRAVPGHGRASVAWPVALDPQQRYFETLATDLRAAIKDGRRIGDAAALSAQGEKANWELFDDFHPRNATAAFEELEWE